MKIPKVKNINPAFLIAGRENEISPILLAFLNLFHMKQIYRRGWLLPGRDIPEDKCESDAEHTFDMIMMAIFLVFKYKYPVNLEKLLIMIAAHDTGEIDPGDTARGEKSEELKTRQEKACIKRIYGDILDCSIIQEILDEYHERKTLEARLAKAIDYSQCLIQSWIYGKQHGKDLSFFMKNAKEKLAEFPELLGLIEDLIKLQ
jgi:putative hydrolases of HD superfamily